MSVTRASIILAAVSGMLWGGVTLAQQDDMGFEALLQDLTVPPVTTAPPAESSAFAVDETEAIDPVAETAPEATAEAAPEEIMSEPMPEAETMSEAEPMAEAEPMPDAEPMAEADVTEVVEEVAAEPAPEMQEAASAAEEVVEEAAAIAAEPVVEEAAPAAEEVAVEATEATASIEDLLGGMASEPEPAPEPAMVEEAPASTAELEDLLPVEPMADVEPEPVPVVEASPEPSPEEAGVMAAEIAEEVADAPSAEESPAPAPAKIKKSEAKLIAQQEEVRRQAREVEGRASLDRAVKAQQAGDLDAAIAGFLDAQAKLPARQANESALAKAKAGLGKAYYDKAVKAYAAEDLKTARQNVDLAIQHLSDPSDAQALGRKITKAEARAAAVAKRPVKVKDRPEIVAREKTIDELLVEGRQYFNLGDYNAAEAIFEKILLQDEYNVDAMRFLRKLDELRYKIRTKEREATEADLMQRVRDAWNPPVREDTVMPQQVAGRGTIETKTSAQRLQEKMEKIIIPSIEFRQANITDVVNFLVDASIAGDKTDGTGVNIILNLNIPGSESAPAPVMEAAPQTDQFGGFGDFGGDMGGGVSAPAAAPAANVPTITLNLRRISLLDAIKYITEVARLKYRLEENVVIITPEGVVQGRVVTRLYPVQPSIVDVIVVREDAPERTGEFVEMGSSRTAIKKSDVKEFFEKAGVPFPAGTSITYNPTISQLIVANTPENLETFERILSRLNVIPNQVEIEARFVEIAQDDLEELGLQWILTDNWELAQKKGAAPLGGTERIQINADPNGFSKGLRFFNSNQNTGSIDPLPATLGGAGITPLGNVLSFASVLTNPELTVIVQALSQHGGSDLLSAPRVTTRSGVNAQIQVVREIIYPTEFETTQPQFNETGNVTTPPVVTPGSFETRETGVILNVTPTVGPDGYTIDLTMVPEVSELVDWIQYGSTIQLNEDQSFTFNIPQPIFASRNVTTSIVIWDGQTVVMGGLIREDLVKVKDKIPIIGDIPVIGRLFRSEGEYSRKKNLLIFVTARLVDPAGKPIHRGETLGVAEGDAAAAGGAVATP